MRECQLINIGPGNISGLEVERLGSHVEQLGIWIWQEKRSIEITVILS
jgi:hypothetical protein